MSKKFVNMDDGESIFFENELTSIKSKSYDVKYPELKARQLFPVSFEAGPGAETIKYYQYDAVGIAKIIGAYSDDLPRADVKGKEFISSVRSLASSYGYNLQEIRAAKMANKPLEQRRSNAAKRSIMQLENKIAFNGDSAHNIQGFLSNANINTLTIAADGTGSSKLFSTKTPDQILRDMNACVNNASNLTLDTEVSDTLLMPVAQYNLIASTARSAYSDKTILQYFMETNPTIKSVEKVNELKGAGASGADVMVAYRRDPDAISLEVPQDFEQLEVQPKGLEYIVPCHSRIGGVLIYYPMAVTLASGI